MDPESARLLEYVRGGGCALSRLCGAVIIGGVVRRGKSRRKKRGRRGRYLIGVVPLYSGSCKNYICIVTLTLK